MHMEQIISSENCGKNIDHSCIIFGTKSRENGREMWFKGKLKLGGGLQNEH